jgi:translation initiation factor IF-2
MPRYGMDYGRDRMYGGGMGRTGYGADYSGGWGGGRNPYGGGFRRGGMRHGSEYGGYGGSGGYQGGMNREGGFRGRAQAYDTYFRRDFLTNQGDFTSDFGGGEEYGYRGMGRRGGMQSGGYGGERSPDRGNYGGAMRGEDRTSYGPGYGERWETTQPEDIARRNFNRR